MFNLYPYLELNDLNLDFILNAIREMKYEVTNFVSINAIKYADPIQWNITSQYEKNTIVIDPVTGTAYISVAPVPSGVSLTRPEYWTVVFDLGSFVTRAAQNFTNHWESDTTTTATFPTTTGGWLVWGDVLYKALTNITTGDTYVVDGNIEHFTIEDLYNAYLNTIAQILAMIGDLDNLTTVEKSSLVGALNEVNSRADYLQNEVGDLNNLSTTDKDNLVDAVNEIDGDVGDLNNLNTVDKSSAVNAINELHGSLGALRTQVDAECLNFKNVVIVGDSNAWYLNDCQALQNRYSANVECLAVGGVDFPTVFTDSIVSQVQNIQTVNPDLIIVWGNTNGLTRLTGDPTLADAAVGVLDLDNDNSGSYDVTTEFGAMNYCLDYLTRTYPNSVIIGVIRPDYPNSHPNAFYQDSWFSMAYQVYKKYGVRVLDLNAVAELDSNNADNLQKWWLDAGIHMNPAFWNTRGAQLINSLYADKALSNERENGGYIMPSTIFTSDAATINSTLRSVIGRDPLTFNFTIKTINPVHGVFNLGGYSSSTSFSLIRYSVSALYIYTSPNNTKECTTITNPTAATIYDLGVGIFEINLNNSTMTGLPAAIGGILSIFTNNPAYPNNRIALFVTTDHNIYMATMQADLHTIQWYKSTMTAV